MIADDAPHSAFTDLVYWNNQFICAYRQGRGHLSTDGRIAVLSSSDGEKWAKTAELKLPHLDLRDASLSEAPDGKLVLVGGVAPRQADHMTAPTGTFVAFSRDGRDWTTPEIIIQPGRWLWRVTWHEGKAYGVSYAAPDNKPVTSLLTSETGRKFTTLVPNMLNEGYPTEAVIRFDGDGAVYCLQRREGPANDSALLGVSKKPYKDWKWHDLGMFLGGPNLIQMPDRSWIAAGRIVHGGVAKTDLGFLDVQANTLSSILTFPSGGDTSYPGLVYHDHLLWVSYYSSHEGKSSIYLAKVQIIPKIPVP